MFKNPSPLPRYLYSTNVLVKQQSDVIRSFNTSAWAALGTDARGMHRCAKLCKKEGGGAVCKSWAFCWGAQKTCALLSRLPDSQVRRLTVCRGRGGGGEGARAGPVRAGACLSRGW